MINSKYLFYGAMILIGLTMTGCYSRKESQPAANHSVSNSPKTENSTKASTGKKPTNNEITQTNADIDADRYATPLPGTVVTDLTVPEGMVTTYDNKRPYSGTSKEGPGGFDDSAGASALNLNRELMNRGRPKDASKRVSDPTIPSAIPSDEVAVNTDFSQPTSYGAYNAGSGRPAEPPVASTDYPSKSTAYGSNTAVTPSYSNRTDSETMYTVMKGDTLYSIARKHQVSVGQILSANDNLDNPDQLFAGQDLLIP